MKLKLVKGKTVEEQLASIDLLLQRTEKRFGTKVVGVLPPVPLVFSKNSVTAGEIILEAILPVGGLLKTAAIKQDNDGRDKPMVVLGVTTDDKTVTYCRALSKKTEVYEFNLPVRVGSVVKLTLEAGQISNVLVGIELSPNPGDYARKEHVASILEQFTEVPDAKEE